MTGKGKGIKSDILSDLNYIVNTLNSTATTVRGQKGVGCEFCADRLESIARRYQKDIASISSVD